VHTLLPDPFPPLVLPPPRPPLLLLQVGRLWTSLADYFIRRGMFERARNVYDEGLTSVITVRDFSLVYDALTQVGGWAGGHVLRGKGWGWGTGTVGLLFGAPAFGCTLSLAIACVTN
jgi:hypothetical protein